MPKKPLKVVFIRLNNEEEVKEQELYLKNQARKGATLSGTTKAFWRNENEKELNK